jgi:hypothetical protein
MVWIMQNIHFLSENIDHREVSIFYIRLIKRNITEIPETLYSISVRYPKSYRKVRVDLCGRADGGRDMGGG